MDSAIWADTYRPLAIVARGTPALAWVDLP